MRESKLWFWHILSAAAILILLGAHIGVMHLSAVAKALGIGSGDPLQSAEVFRRSRQLLFLITYMLLLGSGLFHGLYGFRSMLLELSFSKKPEKIIGGLCALAGVALFIYGSYVAVRVFQMKGGL
jgi:succinate dehydrogenase hydrophobic anchor subunit